MELQTQLENMTERNWNKEKMELLERFDNERKEWECQWKVMQKKIEELYQEVKLRRESNMNAFENKAIHSKAPQQSHFPTLEWSDTPGLNSWSLDKDSVLPRAEKESKDTRNRRRNHVLLKDNLDFESYKESGDFPGLKTTKNYTQDLNIALKELAKVSEDLCSYQEEIRKKSNHRRKKLFPFLGESVEMENTREVNHTNNKDPQPASTVAEKEEQNNRKNLMGTSRCLKEMPPIAGVEKTSFLPWQKREAPPVPPRSTSRHLTSSLAHVSEALAKDTEHKTNGKTQDYLDGNPSINPPFAKQMHASMLLTNEWKSVTGPAAATTVPTEKRDPSLECKFPAGFCHNTWSCDTSPVGDCPNNGSFSHSVQKSCSDGDMVPQKQHPKLQSGVHYSSDIYTPVCDTLGDSGYGTGKTQRNETLEAKIDEFNRTVFHTDKGQRCLQQTQMLSAPSGDPKPHCILEDCMANRTQNEEESTCIVNPGLPSRKEEKPFKFSKNVRATGQQKQLNGYLSGYQHMLHEHDWRPSNLSGRPRSADSRSNYGVVEKLLKNYEKSTSLWNSKFQKEQWMQPNSESADGSSEKWGHYFEMFQADQGKQEQQKNSVRHIGLYTKHGKEKQKFPEVFVPAKQSNGKGFSRPARPANRRLPSRWASRSPSAPPAVRRTTLNELS